MDRAKNLTGSNLIVSDEIQKTSAIYMQALPAPIYSTEVQDQILRLRPNDVDYVNTANIIGLPVLQSEISNVQCFLWNDKCGRSRERCSHSPM